MGLSRAPERPAQRGLGRKAGPWQTIAPRRRAGGWSTLMAPIHGRLDTSQPYILRLPARPSRGLIGRCGDLRWQLFCVSLPVRRLPLAVTRVVPVIARRPAGAWDGPTSERHAAVRRQPDARRKTLRPLPSLPPSMVRRLGTLGRA